NQGDGGTGQSGGGGGSEGGGAAGGAGGGASAGGSGLPFLGQGAGQAGGTTPAAATRPGGTAGAAANPGATRSGLSAADLGPGLFHLQGGASVGALTTFTAPVGQNVSTTETVSASTISTGAGFQ